MRKRRRVKGGRGSEASGVVRGGETRKEREGRLRMGAERKERSKSTAGVAKRAKRAWLEKENKQTIANQGHIRDQRVKGSREVKRRKGGRSRVEVQVKGRKERDGALVRKRSCTKKEEVRPIKRRRTGSVESRVSSQHRSKKQRKGEGARGIGSRKEVRGRRGEVAKREGGRRKEKEAEEWEEERVRVGTGYRVRWGETPNRRTFEVGYGDRKKYRRPEGVEAELGKTKAGRKVKSKGKGARERVIKVVCTREGRRKRSEYTGCGRTRKSRVGKKKLKPTKVRAR
jgi:hypothetical protein